MSDISVPTLLDPEKTVKVSQKSKTFISKYCFALFGIFDTTPPSPKYFDGVVTLIII